MTLPNKLQKKTTKIKFRKINHADLEILRDWRNIPGIIEYSNQFTLLNMLNQERWYNQITKKNSDRLMFMVIKDKKPIGICGLIHVDKKNQNADVAILIGEPRSRRKGYGSEILEMLINYGFNKLKLHRIGAEILMYNKPSVKLFQKMNFTYDATLRDSLWRFGKWWDIYLYSLIRDDYQLSK